jgi:ELWxxDGT repeat protein
MTYRAVTLVALLTAALSIGVQSHADPPASTIPLYFATLDGSALFINATQRGSTSDVWITDGSEAGTIKLAHISDTLSSDIHGAVRVGNFVYFSVADDLGFRLWRTDGTPSSTEAVTPHYDIAPVPLAAIGDTVLLLKERRQLWSYDGGVETFVATIHSGTPRWEWVATIGQTVYIATEGGLIKTDGTTAGTRKILAYPAVRIVANGNRLFFVASSPDSGLALWMSDGTEAGTHALKEFRSTPLTDGDQRWDLIPFGTGVAFLTELGDFGVSDGTAAGTEILRVSRASPWSPPYFNMAVLDGAVFFPFDDGQSLQLWVSRGTASTTSKITSTITNSSLFSLVASTNRVYFYAFDAEHGYELWESDGAPAGTYVVRDIQPGPASGTAESYLFIVTAGDRAYFSADDREHGNEPWVTDGTDSGTRMIANVTPDPSGSANRRRRVVRP